MRYSILILLVSGISFCAENDATEIAKLHEPGPIRSSTIKKQVQILKQKGKSDSDSLQIKKAITLLGDIRAWEAVEPLVDIIKFRWEGEIRELKPLRELFPALDSLLKIGPSAIPYLMEVISKEPKGSDKSDWCDACVRHISGGSYGGIRPFYERFAERNSDRELANRLKKMATFGIGLNQRIESRKKRFAAALNTVESIGKQNSKTKVILDCFDLLSNGEVWHGSNIIVNQLEYSAEANPIKALVLNKPDKVFPAIRTLLNIGPCVLPSIADSICEEEHSDLFKLNAAFLVVKLFGRSDAALASFEKFTKIYKKDSKEIERLKSFVRYFPYIGL